MPYVGKAPVSGGFHKLDNLTASATDTYALTLGSAAYYPETANQLLVSLNGVIQAPQDSFTVSGSNLIFDTALTASDSIDFVVALGDVLGVGSVTDGAVTTNKIANGAVTDAKIAAMAASKLTGALPASVTSSGVYLGGTGSANLLDDYEEGTWTPVDGSGAGLSLTQHRTSHYIKIGRLVLFNFYIIYPSTSSTATASIGGLPYAVTSSGYFYANYRAAGFGANNLLIQLSEDSTVMSLYNADVGYSNATLSGDYILASGSYLTS